MLYLPIAALFLALQPQCGIAERHMRRKMSPNVRQRSGWDKVTRETKPPAGYPREPTPEVRVGIFDALFGRKRPSAGAAPIADLKLKLIRSFIKKRTIQDPMASAMGFSPDMVDELPLPMLMGMPEATLVTIVESFAILKRQGLTDARALQQLESSRGDSYADDIPAGMTLEAYCGYRVSKEHPAQDGQGEISAKHIFECVELARTLYRC